MTNGKALLSDDLLQQVQEAARVENREPSDVISAAVQQYLEAQSCRRFVENNERTAGANGISEDDVDRLIAEYRQEKADRRR